MGVSEGDGVVCSGGGLGYCSEGGVCGCSDGGFAGCSGGGVVVSGSVCGCYCEAIAHAWSWDSMGDWGSEGSESDERT